MEPEASPLSQPSPEQTRERSQSSPCTHPEHRQHGAASAASGPARLLEHGVTAGDTCYTISPRGRDGFQWCRQGGFDGRSNEIPALCTRAWAVRVTPSDNNSPHPVTGLEMPALPLCWEDQVATVNTDAFWAESHARCGLCEHAAPHARRSRADEAWCRHGACSGRRQNWCASGRTRPRSSDFRDHPARALGRLVCLSSLMCRPQSHGAGAAETTRAGEPRDPQGQRGANVKATGFGSPTP